MESLEAIIGNKKSSEECGLGWIETLEPEGVDVAMGQRGDPLSRKLSAQLGIPYLKTGRDYEGDGASQVWRKTWRNLGGSVWGARDRAITELMMAESWAGR
jgi:hypothetical protein